MDRVVIVLGRIALAIAVLSPLAGAAASLTGDRLQRYRRATTLSWLGAAAAMLTVITVAISGPFTASLGGASPISLTANQLTATLLLLIVGVGGVVQSYSARYLQADTSGPNFFAAASIVVAAMAVVSTSTRISLLVIAWVIAGLAFVAVLRYRSDIPGMSASAQRTLSIFAAGDLALVAALALILAKVGDINLTSATSFRISAARLGGPAVAVAALVAIAALARSAQGPLGRWLPGTVAAPTPASALLHAGVVNGGGILLIRLGFLASGSAWVTAATFAVAAGTAIVASAAVTRKPDVKGALVFSTMSQMGFMVAECTVGAYLAALIHLFGHALYKANLFLGSGSQVRRGGQPVAAPTTPSLGARAAASLGTSALAMAASAEVPGALASRGAYLLLAFAGATAFVAGWSWWGHRPPSMRASALWVGIMLGTSSLYGLFIGGAGAWITPAIPAGGSGLLNPAWLLAVALGGIGIAAATRFSPARSRLTLLLLGLGTPPLPRLAPKAPRSGFNPASARPLSGSPAEGAA